MHSVPAEVGVQLGVQGTGTEHAQRSVRSVLELRLKEKGALGTCMASPPLCSHKKHLTAASHLCLQVVPSTAIAFTIYDYSELGRLGCSVRVCASAHSLAPWATKGALLLSFHNDARGNACSDSGNTSSTWKHCHHQQ